MADDNLGVRLEITAGDSASPVVARLTRQLKRLEEQARRLSSPLALTKADAALDTLGKKARTLNAEFKQLHTTAAAGATNAEKIGGASFRRLYAFRPRMDRQRVAQRRRAPTPLARSRSRWRPPTKP